MKPLRLIFITVILLTICQITQTRYAMQYIFNVTPTNNIILRDYGNTGSLSLTVNNPLNYISLSQGYAYQWTGDAVLRTVDTQNTAVQNFLEALPSFFSVNFAYQPGATSATHSIFSVWQNYAINTGQMDVTVAGLQPTVLPSKNAYYKFTSSSTFTVVNAVTCTILLVGGGGSGSVGEQYNMNGGGGGDVIEKTATLQPGVYTATIGAGATGNTATWIWPKMTPAAGAAGQNSQITNSVGNVVQSLVAAGGGGGCSVNPSGSVISLSPAQFIPGVTSGGGGGCAANGPVVQSGNSLSGDGGFLTFGLSAGGGGPSGGGAVGNGHNIAFNTDTFGGAGQYSSIEEGAPIGYGGGGNGGTSKSDNGFGGGIYCNTAVGICPNNAPPNRGGGGSGTFSAAGGERGGNW
jgi:hypothetical protein